MRNIVKIETESAKCTLSISEITEVVRYQDEEGKYGVQIRYKSGKATSYTTDNEQLRDNFYDKVSNEMKRRDLYSNIFSWCVKAFIFILFIIVVVALAYTEIHSK